MKVTKTGVITLALPVVSGVVLLYWASWDMLCLMVVAGWLYGLTYEPLKKITNG